MVSMSTKFLYTLDGGQFKPIGDDPSNIIDLQGIEFVSGVDSSSDNGFITKAYADAIAQGALKIHVNVRVASTADLSAVSGGSGILQASSGTAPLTVDGVLLAATDRVLVKNQTDTTQNGVYTLTQQGNNDQLSWKLNRSGDSDIILGSYAFVEFGTVNKDSGFIQYLTVDTVDTDPIKFTIFSKVESLNPIDGLTRDGLDIGIDLESSSPLTLTAGKLDIPKATGSVDGYLSKEDHAALSAKESVLSFTLPLDRSGNTVFINIVDDLTTGGASSVLSAKQGKALEDTKAPITNPILKGNVVIENDIVIQEPTKNSNPITKLFFDTNTPGAITDLTDIADSFGTQGQILQIDANELKFVTFPGFFGLTGSPAAVDGNDEDKVLTVNTDGSISFNTFSGNFNPEVGEGIEVTSERETQGFLTIDQEPSEASGIKVFLDEVGLQVGYALSQGTSKTPDYKYINDNGVYKLYFKNLDGVTGLAEESELFEENAFYSVFYVPK